MSIKDRASAVTPSLVFWVQDGPVETLHHRIVEAITSAVPPRVRKTNSYGTAFYLAGTERAGGPELAAWLKTIRSSLGGTALQLWVPREDREAIENMAPWPKGVTVVTQPTVYDMLG